VPFVPFNSETARLAGIASGLARRSTKVEFLEPVPSIETIIEHNRARTVTERLKILGEQIAQTRAVLNAAPKTTCIECGQEEEMPAHHRAQLLRALDALIEREMDLLGLATRPTRKVGHDRPTRLRLPDPTPSCGPDTPTGSG
jgi:hypothetical protein